MANRHSCLVLTLLASPAAGLIASPLVPHRSGSNVVLQRPHPTASLAVVAAVPRQVAVSVGLNSGIAALGVAKNQGMLTPSGLANAWVLGVVLWATLGWRGWSTCVLYLLAGSAVTKVKKAKKESMGIAEGRGGKRGPENVWGSAATAALCALGAVAWPAWNGVLRLGFVASLATKLSDTCASEIGKAYGKSTYLITTLKPVPPGTEGAVSLEGTAAGAVGSVVLAGYAVGCGLVGGSAITPCIVAAFVATNCESLIGASAQGRFAWLTNEVVNFVNTLIGALVAVAFGGPLWAKCIAGVVGIWPLVGALFA